MTYHQTRPAAVFVTAADGGRWPRLDRNARASLMFRAEALDRRTREPGRHGGVLKRTGLAVFKALLFGFHNVATGRCDPSYDALARLAGVARSTVAVALRRLEAAGLVVRVARVRRARVNGARVALRATNAYRFPTPAGPTAEPESESRAGTTNPEKTQSNQTRGFEGEGERRAVTGFLPELQRALARLGHAMADRRDADRPHPGAPAGDDG